MSSPTSRPRRFTVPSLRAAKESAKPIVMLTAYDGVTAAIFESAGIDVLLVGDSIGDNLLGHPSTLPVTLDEMVLATRSVSRATTTSLVVADLPFGSYEASPQQAHASAVRLMKEGGAQAVKLEGGTHMADQVRLLTNSGIPVVGHLGLTPQSENLIGGKKVQGRGEEAAAKLRADAVALQEAGAVALVLEMVPEGVADALSRELTIPTIGIGAGAGCDGQVLVWLDMAGMTDWSPRFARTFGEVGAALRGAATAYADAVRDGSFPAAAESFTE